MWHDEQSVAGFIECLSIPQKLLAVNNLSLFYAAAFIPLYKYETATRLQRYEKSLILSAFQRTICVKFITA